MNTELSIAMRPSPTSYKTHSRGPQAMDNFQYLCYKMKPQYAGNPECLLKVDLNWLR